MGGHQYFGDSDYEFSDDYYFVDDNEDDNEDYKSYKFTADPTKITVVGMRYKNKDWKILVGAILTVVPEPTNKYDANAKLVLLNGKPFGYISRDNNKTEARFLKVVEVYKASIKCVTNW